MGSLEWRCVSLALLLLHCAVPIASQGGCSVPDEQQIKTALQSLLGTQPGENPSLTSLNDHHFTCLGGIQSRDSYRFLSVVTNFTRNDMTMGISQFQMQCTSGNFITDTQLGVINLSPDSSVFNILTREDCWACSSPSPFFMNDPIANCFFCDDQCRMLGQGACKAFSPVLSDCCPFFLADGTCTLSCPNTNYEASNNTDYTCECVLPCTELGYAPNPTCTACIEVHICLIGDPCENGATCNIGLTNTTDYNCSCTYNHTGLNCEECPVQCPLGYAIDADCNECVPVHICLTDNPCQNEAPCVIGNTNTAYNCSCLNSYVGQNCETCSLVCSLGYGPNNNCSFCEAKHNCLTDDPCQNGSTCVINSPTINNYTCVCAQHFTGQHCEVCIYPCDPGYQITGQCDGCIAVHRCVTDDPCLNGATCLIGSGGNDDYTCDCADGFVGLHCNLSCSLTCPPGYRPNDTCGGCKAVHICITNDPCQHLGTCVIGAGRDVNNYTCNCIDDNARGKDCEFCILPCLDGYSTDGLCQECLISDVCIATKPCKNDGTCTTRGDAGYECSCTDTWRGTQCTECAIENCVQCALDGCVECVSGYNVDLNTRQCVPISELPLWAIGVIVGVIVAVLVAIFVAGVIVVIVKACRLSSGKINSVDREKDPLEALNKATDEKKLVVDDHEEEKM